MEEKNTPKKLTYDELKQAAAYWQKQAQFFEKKAKELNEGILSMNLTNEFRRLDFLFKVVENAKQFSSDFVVTCVTEIETALSPIPEEHTEAKEE